MARGCAITDQVRVAEFALERYFARWEFTAKYHLCASDVEPLALPELLSLADAELQRLWQTLRLGYTETQGHPLLRNEIARLYDSIAADEILTFCGAQEAIFLTVHALLEAGDHIVVVTPPCYRCTARSRSIRRPMPLLRRARDSFAE